LAEWAREQQLVQAQHDRTQLAIDRVKTIEHPIERLVAVVRLLGHGTPRDDAEGRVCYPTNREVLWEVCPETWPTRPNNLGASPESVEMRGWNGLEVAQWFAAAAGVAGLVPDVLVSWHSTSVRKGVFGTSVKRTEGAPEPTWLFPNPGRGAFSSIDFNDKIDAYVLPDGRLGSGRPPEIPVGPDREARLRACALMRMAELLNLDFRPSP